MRRVRVIPALLIDRRKLVKTTRFKNPGYVGDPINALKIFNEKEVDEICVLDIRSSREQLPPDIEYIHQLASECFMPLAYGGGITSLNEAKEIYKAGVEKVILGTAAIRNPNLIAQIADNVGVQGVVVSIDVKKNWLGRYKIFSRSANADNTTIAKYAAFVEKMGAGEILLQNVDREGTLAGYDVELIKSIAEAVSIPVIASGGASSVDDFLAASQAGASAVSAGTMFVYQGKHKAVLINYPDQNKLKEEFFSKL